MPIAALVPFLIFFVQSAQKGASGQATVHKYQNNPLTVQLGECVNITARSYYSVIDRPAVNVQVIWKRDTLVISNTKPWLYFSYSKLSDSAFYQVEIHNTDSNIIEETQFWLSVHACKPNEKESPETSGQCKSSCVEACASGWTYLKGPNGDKCYKYFGEPKTWLAARAACQAIGSELAIIENSKENRFIGALLQSGDGGWIGLNDRDFESRFIWNDGNIGAVKYTAWAEGEPNNLNFECNIENCVVMIRSSGKWADTICNGIYPYVCEIPFKNISGWSCSGSKCYRYFEQYAVWNDAKAGCHAKGGRLAKIMSQLENDFIWKLIRNDVWIGLNDIGEAGEFVWNDATYSLQTLPFENWAHEEPNDVVFISSPEYICEGEDCVLLKDWQSKTSWHDANCFKKVPYVCEKRRESLLSLGMIVGVATGSMIAVAIGAGMISSALRKRNREQLKMVLLNALERDYSSMVDRLEKKHKASQLKRR